MSDISVSDYVTVGTCAFLLAMTVYCYVILRRDLDYCLKQIAVLSEHTHKAMNVPAREAMTEETPLPELPPTEPQRAVPPPPRRPAPEPRPTIPAPRRPQDIPTVPSQIPLQVQTALIEPPPMPIRMKTFEGYGTFRFVEPEDAR